MFHEDEATLRILLLCKHLLRSELWRLKDHDIFQDDYQNCLIWCMNWLNFYIWFRLKRKCRVHVQFMHEQIIINQFQYKSKRRAAWRENDWYGKYFLPSNQNNREKVFLIYCCCQWPSNKVLYLEKIDIKKKTCSSQLNDKTFVVHEHECWNEII